MKKIFRIVALIFLIGVFLVPVAVFGTTLEYRPDADPETTSVDGWTEHYHIAQTWAIIHDGVGTGFNDDQSGDPLHENLFARISGSATGDTWGRLRRATVLFDTSDLPDGAYIGSAVLKVYGIARYQVAPNNPTLNVFTSTPNSDTALEAADYTDYGTTPLCDTAITYNEFNTSGYNEFELNAAGIATISKTGITKLALREATYDAPNIEPTWTSQYLGFEFYPREESSGKSPVLAVTYVVTPVLTTNAATYVELTAARLNSTILGDGGSSCNVSFQYHATTENWTACDNTSWVSGYTTGQHPYADIMGLTPDTLYYFRARAVNVEGSANATALTFTTAAEVLIPSNFKAFPEAERVVLSWTKGAGSTNTLVRYKEGAYADNITEGSQVYAGSLGAYAHTGLTPGHSYYYSAWAYSGDNYTATYATVMATTLPLPAPSDTFTAPDMPPSWFGTPDYTKFSAIPLYPFINLCADAAGMPRNSFWLIGTLFGCVFAGVVAFAVSKDGRPAMITVAVAMSLASVIELLPMFMMGLAVIVFIGAMQLRRGAR